MDLRRHHISLGALTVATLFAVAAGVPAAEPASATTSAPCPQPLCSDRNCRITNTGPNNCPECDCTPCPELQCAPGCRPETGPLPGGRCPTCVCELPPPRSRHEMDVPCFTPLLREALRRLAEVEEQLHQLHLLTHENGLRLHRLLPPAEHHHHHHHHAGGAPAATTASDDVTPKSHHPKAGDLDVPETSRRAFGNSIGAVLPSKNSNNDDSSDSDETIEPQRYDHPKHHHHQSHHHHQQHKPHSHHNKTHHQHSGTASQHLPLHRDHNRLLQRDHQKEIKLSETEYDLAICKLQPNKAIAEELQQPVQGLISLWQQKGTSDLNVHVHVTGLKVNESARDHRAFMHGMHVHELGNLTDGCQSTGPHFNPANGTHGDRRATVRHVGDFGNIACDKHGETNVIFTDTMASLTGPWSIVGRSINIHARMDDLGRNKDNPASVSSGDSGPRVACCVIEKVDKLPQLSSKAAKRILRDIMQPFSDFENE